MPCAAFPRLPRDSFDGSQYLPIRYRGTNPVVGELESSGPPRDIVMDAQVMLMVSQACRGEDGETESVSYINFFISYNSSTFVPPAGRDSF